VFAFLLLLAIRPHLRSIVIPNVCNLLRFYRIAWVANPNHFFPVVVIPNFYNMLYLYPVLLGLPTQSTFLMLFLFASPQVGVSRELPHLPNILFIEAKEWLDEAGSDMTGTGNFYDGHVDHSDEDYQFVYVNKIPLSRGGVPVTAQRSKVHQDCLAHGRLPRNVRTLVAFEKNCLSLYEVCIAIHIDTDTNHELMGHSCDCRHFWLMRTCPHLLATLHLIRAPGVDVFRSLDEPYVANRAKGRPRRTRRGGRPGTLTLPPAAPSK
jgi:hypothetical protein